MCVLKGSEIKRIADRIRKKKLPWIKVKEGEGMGERERESESTRVKKINGVDWKEVKFRGMLIGLGNRNSPEGHDRRRERERKRA